MRVYLDTCALQRPLDDASQLRVYLETEAILGVIALIEEGAVELLSSEAVTYEAARNPYTDRRDYAFTVLARAAAEVPASEPVRMRARNYLGSGIKPLDALHLASAVEGRAEFFCTCDDRLRKRADTIDTHMTRVVTPQEPIMELTR